MGAKDLSTRNQPWSLRTRSGSSEYQIHAIPHPPISGTMGHLVLDGRSGQRPGP